MSKIQFNRNDVGLRPLPTEVCSSCDNLATCYIEIDLRAVGATVALDGEVFCQACGEDELEAIRASMPEPLNEDGTYLSVGEADVGGA